MQHADVERNNDICCRTLRLNKCAICSTMLESDLKLPME